MTPRALRTGTVLAIGAALLLHPASAMAQAAGQTNTAAAEAKTRAQVHFKRGIDAYKAERYKDAIDSFLDAHREFPSPTLSFNAALAYEKLQDSAGALRFYREYLRQNTSAQDQTTVQARIVEHEKRLQERGVQQVTILSQPEAATVIIDERPVGVTPWTGEIFPGRHALRVRREGYTDLTQEFELLNHRAMDISVSLEPAPAAATPTPTPGPATQPTAQSGTDVRLDEKGLAKVTLPTWVTLGTGVAVLGAAGAFELMRSSAESDVKNEKTQVDRHDAFDKMESRQTTSRVLAGVGAAVVVVGGVLLYFDLSRKSERTSSAWAGAGCTHLGCKAELGGHF